VSGTARERLVAQVAVLLGVEHKDHEAFDVDTAWERGEVYVAALELEPDKPVQCPCCTKLVTLCVKHYQLHEPGKKCVTCRGEGEC
jgi:hypothetical protein